MKRFFYLIVIGTALFWSRGSWLPLLGTSLRVPDQLFPADCIVVLRGDDYFRLRKAAALQKAEMAPVIVTSVISAAGQPYDLVRKISGLENLSEEDLTRKMFQYFGGDPATILFTGKETTSTFEEAVAAREFLRKRGFHSLLLVTSTYHMRRALFIFERLFEGTGIRIYHSTAVNVLYHPEEWWKQERDVRRVFEEYVSIPFNYFYHFVFKKNSTSFDTV